jgi:hypothetical protein
MTEERKSILNDLVNEVTRDDSDLEVVKVLTGKLGIPYSDDPMQLLNNVLKGIHFEGPFHEQTGQDKQK